MAVFMWLISRAAPSLHFDLPAHRWLAGVLVSTGFVTGISGVVTFLKAKTTVDPTKPRTSSFRRTALRDPDDWRRIRDDLFGTAI
jgi:hypothetical protein